MRVLSAVTHLGRQGPIWAVGPLGGLNRGVRVVIAAAALGSGWLLVGVRLSPVFAGLAALAVTLLASAVVGFSPSRTFLGWRLRLGAADYAGRALAWLVAGGRLVLLSLGATVAAILLLPIHWWEGVLGWSITALFVAAIRAQVRVVIEDFDDYRTPASPEMRAGAAADAGEAKADNGKGKDTGGAKDAGTAVLLANRLAAMRELYEFVDDPDRTPTPNRPSRATIQLEDPSSVLRSAVTTESTVSFGGFSIPLGAAMGLLGRLVRAPRLRGAIHGDEHRLVVTAELMIDGQPFAWHVEKQRDSARGADRTLEALITDELAYQIFSDLTLQRQARWPATRYWLLALESMAGSQRRQRNRQLLFRETESDFRQALAEDERFYLACLNLGIVYRRLAERQPLERSRDYMSAARGVFEWAVRMSPERWEAYHALADAHWEAYREDSGSDGSLEVIAGLCARALALKPDRAARARILDLQGQAQTAAARLLDGDRATQADLFRAATYSRLSACWLAMSELARTRLRRVSPVQAARLSTQQNLAAQCLLNLARTAREAHVAAQDGRRLTYAVPPEQPGKLTGRDRRLFRAGRQLGRLAFSLADADAVAHQRLAEFAYSNGKLEIAAAEASAAARIAPADPRYSAQLAFVLAKQGRRELAQDACARAARLVDFGDPDHNEAQQWVIAAYHALAQPKHAKQLETRRSLACELDKLRKNNNYSVGELRKRLNEYGVKRDWEAARVRMELGKLILGETPLQARAGTAEAEIERRSQEAEQLLCQALAWFEQRQPSEKLLAQLHSGIAQALLRRPGERNKALSEAERATILAPLEAQHHNTLSCVYELGGDLKSACTAADNAVLLDPDDAGLHHRSAMLKWKVAETLADPAAHKQERQAASARFEQTLKLYASEDRRERETTSWWLAMSYFAMSEFERVPAHLQFVLASSASAGPAATDEDRKLSACAELWLAKTYRKLGKYLDAKDHAHEAVKTAEQLHSAGVQLSDGLADTVADQRWPLWIVLALSHLQLAGCHTDRGGTVKRAERSLTTARDVFKRTEQTGTDVRETDTYAEYLAEMGRFLLATDQAAASIRKLQDSVDIDPDEADVYLLLARAHKQAAEQEIEAGWQAHIRGARAACKHTIEIGGTDHPDASKAAEIEEQLDLLTAEASERATASRRNGNPSVQLADAPLRPRSNQSQPPRRPVAT